MKRTICRIAVTIICCLAFGAVAFAAGESYTKELIANYVGVQLVVHGTEVTPKDANGSVVEPFIVDGTTYLPVRAVAEALGEEVSWDGTTKTIYIGEKPEQISVPTPKPTQESETVLENVVYAANGITIEIGQPKYDNSRDYYFVDLSVKNERTVDIYYDVQYLKVNGFQLPTFSFGTIYSGMSSNVQVYFSSDDMRLASIDHILNIEICVKMSDSDNRKNVIDMPVLSLQTPDAEKYTQSFDFDWEEVYNKDGLQILARLGKPEESYPAVFYVYNSTGYTISLSYNDIAINDSMIGLMMTGTQVVDGAKCVTGMERSLLEMMSGSVPENRDISSVTLELSIMPIGKDGSFSTADIYYSDKITITR